MDRLAWLNQQRRISEEQEDKIYSPIYDEYWGEIDPLHRRCFEQFLGLCPPEAQILDAPCGTGKYWSMILDSGRTVYGIDQSQGMIDRAHAKFLQVPIQKTGLQEMSFDQAFHGAACIDALEMVPPEDWPVVMSNFYKAIKARGYFYFTVEFTTEEEITKAYQDGLQAGLPVVYGEWAYEGSYLGEWAQEGGYHYYPRLEQVREWARQAGFHLISEAVGEEYYHFLAQRQGAT